jgi:hypothetical protein
LIADRGKLKKIGLTAQKTISKNWEKVVDEVYENYLEIINQCSIHRTHKVGSYKNPGKYT